MSIDSLVEEHKARYRVPGLSLAVSRHGTVIHAAGYGFANLEHRVAATVDTIYQTASVGKQFTAALTMLLAERGLLTLDDRIGKWFEEAPGAWESITIRHLLTHTAGISDESVESLNYRLDYTDSELLRAIMAPALEFLPGSAWNYSNAGYVLLGQLIARVSGKFYGDLLREWIFAPIEMSSAQVISEADVIPHRAAGYCLESGVVRNQEYVSPTLNRTADGGLYVSVADLAKWDRELAGGTLLSTASREAMWTAVGNWGYGFGWEVESSPRGRLVQHDGEWQGFSTHFRRYLEDGLSVMILSNLADAPVRELAEAISATL